MRTLFELCMPRDDVLKGGIRESEFAADLAQVLRKEGPLEYRDPATFFANTHPTDGLKRLLDNVCRRRFGERLGRPVMSQMCAERMHLAGADRYAARS